MIGLIITLAVLLGVGGTVTVADNARPGDTFFGIDQAVEKLRINITRKENKNELRIRFAEERIKEVDELEKENKTVNGSTESLTEDQMVKVNTGIESALDLLTDLDENEETDDARLESLAALLSKYLDSLPADARVQVSDDRLRIKFDGGPEKIEIKDQGENKTKMEVRTEEGRIRVEVKDGMIEIKTKIEDEDDSLDDAKNEIEIEAKILSDKTIIEVEIGDEKTTFATSGNTREAIIAAIVANFPSLTSAQVDAALKIETENDDDDSDDDDKDDDNDEEEDNDDSDGDSDDDEGNSGSNSGSSNN